MRRMFSSLKRFLKAIATNPREFARVLNMFHSICRAHHFTRTYKAEAASARSSLLPLKNPLLDYFKNHKVGHGIWKWEHYFEIYDQHFSRFIGQKVDVMEIGIYSGGSLEMWRSYFGDKSHIYGVDIEDACRAYENDYTSVFIGDQADREFWRTFKKEVKGVDIIIDDGGHTPEQQQITLEEMLPYLRPGGVYICEDVHDVFNRFSGFATSLARDLNVANFMPGATPQCRPTQFQASIHSIHFYPYMVVIQKHEVERTSLMAPKQGTKWQPFVVQARTQARK